MDSFLLSHVRVQLSGIAHLSLFWPSTGHSVTQHHYSSVIALVFTTVLLTVTIITMQTLISDTAIQYQASKQH